MPKRKVSDRTIAISCLAFFFGMVGMAFAAVPLYAMFCQVTGYGGTTQRVEQMSDTILDKKITVRFDANTSGGLPWQFEPVQRDVTMNIGETKLIKYEARKCREAHCRSCGIQCDAAGGRGVFQQGRVLLLHRYGPEAR